MCNEVSDHCCGDCFNVNYTVNRAHESAFGHTIGTDLTFRHPGDRKTTADQEL